MILSVDAICHKGLVRENNEDALSVGGLFLRDDATDLSLTLPEGEEGYFYLLVSDGMGGHENGEEASQFTLEEIQRRFSDGRIVDFQDDMRSAVRFASDELNARASRLGQLRPMGCTLTGVVWQGGHCYLINAGDSRTYRLRGGLLRQLTTDEEDAAKYLLNCIGGGCEGRLTIGSLDGKLLEGDTLLVCSDGLTDMVPDEEIEKALDAGCSAEDLLHAALDAGGADNVSIILARIGGRTED